MKKREAATRKCHLLMESVTRAIISWQGDKPRLLQVCSLNTHPHNQHVNRGWPQEKRGFSGEMLIWLNRRPGLRTFGPLPAPLLPCSEVRTHRTLTTTSFCGRWLFLRGISTYTLLFFPHCAHLYSTHAFGRNLHSKFRHWRVIYASNQTHFEVGKTAEGPGKYTRFLLWVFTSCSYEDTIIKRWIPICPAPDFLHLKAHRYILMWDLFRRMIK